MEKGLIFDVDGVLSNTEALNARGTIAMFRELYGVAPEPEDFRPFIGAGDARYVEGPAEKLGITIDTARAVKVREAKVNELLATGVDISFPGVNTLIRSVAAAPHWKLAIATSSFTEKATAGLKAARVPLEPFHAFITGSMVTHKKPHPEIYQVTAAVLGLSPTRCVVVEDALVGVKAAKAAGMKCIAVTNSFPRAELTEADLVVDSLEEVNLSTLDSLISRDAA